MHGAQARPGIVLHGELEKELLAMNGRDSSIPVGDSAMPVYLSRPDEGSGAHPAVIVLPEVFGFTPEVRRMTDLAASIGYVGLAINYYHRINPRMNEPYTSAGSRNAFAAAAQVRPQDVAADVNAAIDWLNAQPFVKGGLVAVWGCGFGATLGLQAASNTRLRGAVLFYPSSVSVEVDVQVPLLLVFGEEDYYVSRHDMNRICETLQRIGPDVRVQIYPEVGHSFFRHGRPEAIAEQARYSDEAVAYAVADSWNLVQRFLRDAFSGSPPPRSAVSGGIRTQHTPQARS
jgi:carboxymethylenebutenolidase